MTWNSVRKMADAIYNDLVSGLRGYHNNVSISIEQLMEEIVQMRLLVIKEYLLKGILPIQDLITSINCISVDCESLDKCTCNADVCESEPTAHFEIPQILFDFGVSKAIQYIGSTDKRYSFLVYINSLNKAFKYHKYRKRGKKKPFVFIDTTPNKNGFLDCYIFGAPLIKAVSVIGIFKDPRQLEEFQCDCSDDVDSDKVTTMDLNYNFIDTLVQERLTKQKLYYYKQLQSPILPNDQQYTT